MIESMNYSCYDDGDADKPYKQGKHIDGMDNMAIHMSILHYFILNYKYLLLFYTVLFCTHSSAFLSCSNVPISNHFHVRTEP